MFNCSWSEEGNGIVVCGVFAAELFFGNGFSPQGGISAELDFLFFTHYSSVLSPDTSPGTVSFDIRN